MMLVMTGLMAEAQTSVWTAAENYGPVAKARKAALI